MGRRGNGSMYTKKTEVHMFVHKPDWLYEGIRTPFASSWRLKAYLLQYFSSFQIYLSKYSCAPT